MAEEDEETFVFVEFTGLPDDKLLKQYKGPCSLLVGRECFFCANETSLPADFLAI